MPAPPPLAVRRLIQRRARRGQSAAAIACALGLRPRTVRQLLRHFGEQLERLEPAYQPGLGQPADRHPLYEVQPWRYVSSIRAGAAQATSASVWPAPLMLRCCPASVPCSVGSVSNTSRRLLPDGRPSTPTSRATAPHDTWQMDAVEQLRLGSGQGVRWLRLVDEYSGAFLGTTVFPHYQWGHVLPTAVQQQRSRTAFTRWGLPCRTACGQRQAVGFVERSASGLGRCG